MQTSKAGVVAVGAIAIVAVVGSAAAAAPAQPAQADLGKPDTTALAIGKALAGKHLSAKDPGIAQPLISIGLNSKTSIMAWSICGSTASTGVGGTVATGSPHLVVGDGTACTNSNLKLRQDNVRGIISILDDSSVRVAPWQFCGSHVAAGVGAVVVTDSPATVIGDCHNANTLIEAPDAAGTSLISVLNASAINALPWQVCGSTAVAGLGSVVAQNSPTTVIGDCTNGGILIEPGPDQASIPLLSNVPLNVLPMQLCEVNGLTSLVGVTLAPSSPGYVSGECYVPDGLPDGLDLG